MKSVASIPMPSNSGRSAARMMRWWSKVGLAPYVARPLVRNVGVKERQKRANDY